MNNLINEFESLIQTVPKLMMALSKADYKANPTKWSKKEILGHLCDSATMNHKRFIERLISKDELTLELYNQNLWVELNNYQNNFPLEEILSLWVSLNKRILILLRSISEEQWNLQYNVDKNNQVTLSWLFTEYIDHLKHHLNQIIN
ncbi:DinB family protein [Bacillus sp. EAC]|uniref:DinB family protein n=1 Tax=Bacillus sp. EAC TaxID=1978338 RepID=UPI000B446403|nr:DinB family protein [Bacillus sp. EAC]